MLATLLLLLALQQPGPVPVEDETTLMLSKSGDAVSLTWEPWCVASVLASDSPDMADPTTLYYGKPPFGCRLISASGSRVVYVLVDCDISTGVQK